MLGPSVPRSALLPVDVKLRDDGSWVWRKDARGALWSWAGWDWIAFF